MSWLLVCGQYLWFLESHLWAALDKAAGYFSCPGPARTGHFPPTPQAMWKAIWQGLDRVLGLSFFDDLGAVKALSRCPCVLLSCAWCARASGEGAMDGGGVVGTPERSGRLLGGKAFPELEGCAIFTPPRPGKRNEGLSPNLYQQTRTQRLSRQRWREDPSWGPIGPVFSLGLQQSSVPFCIFIRSHFSTRVEQLYGLAEWLWRVPAGFPWGRPG